MLTPLPNSKEPVSIYRREQAWRGSYSYLMLPQLCNLEFGNGIYVCLGPLSGQTTSVADAQQGRTRQWSLSLRRHCCIEAHIMFDISGNRYIRKVPDWLNALSERLPGLRPHRRHRDYRPRRAAKGCRFPVDPRLVSSDTTGVSVIVFASFCFQRILPLSRLNE